MSSFTSTADLYDQFGQSCFSCPQQFRNFGKRLRFAGGIRTVQCREDNVILKRMLETRSDGEVLVVDGDGSLNAALIGDAIAGLGARNGWSGVVINVLSRMRPNETQDQRRPPGARFAFIFYLLLSPFDFLHGRSPDRMITQPSSLRAWA